MLLENRVAIITGGAKGMGRGMAVRLAEEGCAVAIADIDVKEGEITIAEVTQKGSRGLLIPCDVTDENQVKAAVEKTVQQFGKVDILVNNAGGITEGSPIENLTVEAWDKTQDLNVKSAFLFTKYVVPLMKAQKYGKIISLSSIGAINPPAHSVAYNTAKAALLGFTYDLAFALAPFNINVNALLPGPIQTHFYDRMIGHLSEQEKAGFFAGLGTKVPLQRIGTPEDMGNAVLFLASDQSSFITGVSLLISGGLPLSPQSAAPNMKL